MFCVAPERSNCSSMRLKSWCYRGIPSTQIAIWAVAITQLRLVTALDRGRQCIVLVGENHPPRHPSRQRNFQQYDPDFRFCTPCDESSSAVSKRNRFRNFSVAPIRAHCVRNPTPAKSRSGSRPAHAPRLRGCSWSKWYFIQDTELAPCLASRNGSKYAARRNTTVSYRIAMPRMAILSPQSSRRRPTPRKNPRQIVRMG